MSTINPTTGIGSTDSIPGQPTWALSKEA